MEWISVKDKLPEMYVDVIVCRRGAVVESGRRINDGWWKVFGVRVKDVTHWQPLPDPPAIAMYKEDRKHDLAPVVLCKDCQYWNPPEDTALGAPRYGICLLLCIDNWRTRTPEAGFCYLGVRKEADE